MKTKFKFGDRIIVTKTRSYVVKGQTGFFKRINEGGSAIVRFDDGTGWRDNDPGGDGDLGWYVSPDLIKLDKNPPIPPDNVAYEMDA